MRKPSIKKRKSNINGQTFVDIQELPKRDPKVSFADSINNLQLKLLSKEMDIEKLKSSSSLPISQEDNFHRSNSNFNGANKNDGKNNNNLYKSYSNKNFLHEKNSDENDKVMKKLSKRHSMRMSQHKSFEDKFLSRKKSQNDLATIKEIVISDKHEGTITNNPKKRFKFSDKEDEGKNNKKKKINVIDELRKFDREQQMKLEDYIDKKRYQQMEFLYKNSKIYKIINNENKDEIDNDFNLNYNNYKIPKYNEFKFEENFFNKYNSINVEKNIESARLQNDNNNTNKENEKNFNNNTIDKNSFNKNNNKDNFQKIKEKYFSQSIYTPRISKTEFKIKYLDKFFQNNNKNSLVKNLFANYIDEKNKNEKNDNNNNNEENINNNNNIFSKEINFSSLNQKENEMNDKENNLNIKNNSVIISPKLLYKKTNETDSSNTLIDSNNKIKNIEQSYNSNMNTINVNRINNKYKLNDELEATYKNIINSIDDKLNNKNKKNKKFISNDNSNRIISVSTDKIKTISNGYSYLFNKNYRDISLLNKNNRYYKEICERYDSINGLKMMPYYNRNSISNNFNRNYNNKDYKYIRIVNQIKSNNQPYKGNVLPF